ncbi:MAG: helix-turn-helix domain-containing protein [Vicinamibacterales bacterium]
MTIVRPDTLVRWNRDLFRLFWRLKSRQRGRPRIPIEVQRLIAEMGTHNRTWGEERIAAELRVKLGLTVSPRTVRRYMPPRPRSRGGRSAQSWTTFLHNHAGANTVILAFLVPRHLVHEVASRRATTCAPGLVIPVRPHCGWNQSLPQKRHLLFFRRYEPHRALR